MAKYSQETIAEVLGAVDIVDVIGAHLELKPAGSARFKALCPFHQEKTPSFSVSRDRQSFYCFGCQKGGDAVSFLREYEGLSFVEALQKLADRAGVRLPAPTARESAEDFQRTQLLKFTEFAYRRFRKNLQDPLKGGAARQYLKTRGLDPETVERFGLGYAPEAWEDLVPAARAAGFRDQVIEASGLARRGDRGGLYDFFRNRLLIPIQDAAGRFVAFGGRDLGDSPAKYINSPENAVYKKGRVLYGLYHARNALRAEKTAVLVEGYFDALRCFDAGVENVVATCGTALTSAQAALLRRYVPEVVVVFDGDVAGVRAALRGIGILTAGGLTVRALILPDGQDPDDFIKAQGVDAFRTLLTRASDFVSFYVRASEERMATIEGRTEVARELFVILLGVDDRLRRDEYLKRMARELHINEWTARTEFGRFLQRGGRDRRPVEDTEPTRRISRDDIDFVAALLGSERLQRIATEAAAALTLPAGPIAEILALLAGGVGPDAVQRLESETARTIYIAAAHREQGDPEAAEDLVQKRVARLRRDALKAEAAQLQEAIEEAQRTNDMDRATELLRQKIGINKQIEQAGVA